MCSKCCEDTQCLLIIISYKIGALVFFIFSIISSNWFIAKFGATHIQKTIGVYKMCGETDCEIFSNKTKIISIFQWIFIGVCISIFLSLLLSIIGLCVKKILYFVWFIDLITFLGLVAVMVVSAFVWIQMHMSHLENQNTNKLIFEDSAEKMKKGVPIKIYFNQLLGSGKQALLIVVENRSLVNSFQVVKGQNMNVLPLATGDTGVPGRVPGGVPEGSPTSVQRAVPGQTRKKKRTALLEEVDIDLLTFTSGIKLSHMYAASDVKYGPELGMTGIFAFIYLILLIIEISNLCGLRDKKNLSGDPLNIF